MVLRESFLLLAAGLVVGLPITLTTAHKLTTFLKELLFQVNALDPLAFLVAAAVICAITPLAAFIPARRATKVDPIAALRCE